MVLKSEELLGTLTKEAKERQAAFHGNRFTGKVDLVSNDEKSTPVKSVDKLAEVAKTSSTMVSRMQRLKRESPVKYSEVVAGDKTISGAYFELPPIRKRKSPTVGYWSKMPNSYPCSSHQYPTVPNSNLLQESPVSQQ